MTTPHLYSLFLSNFLIFFCILFFQSIFRKLQTIPMRVSLTIFELRSLKNKIKKKNRNHFKSFFCITELSIFLITFNNIHLRVSHISK